MLPRSRASAEAAGVLRPSVLAFPPPTSQACRGTEDRTGQLWGGPRGPRICGAKPRGSSLVGLRGESPVRGSEFSQ